MNKELILEIREDGSRWLNGRRVSKQYLGWLDNIYRKRGWRDPSLYDGSSTALNFVIGGKGGE